MVHPQAEFRIIFQKGICPRRSTACIIGCVRRGRSRAPIDGRTASRIRDLHAIAHHLGDQFDVWRFATAGAGTGKLEQRLFKLAAFHRIDADRIFLVRQADHIIPIIVFFKMVFTVFHLDRFFAGGTGQDADTAARAIGSGNLDPVFIVFVRAHPVQEFHTFRGIGCLVFCGQERPDGGMRTNKGALIALDAFLRVPDRYLYRDFAFLVFRRPLRESTVSAVHKGADRQLVAFHPFHHAGDVADKIRFFS